MDKNHYTNDEVQQGILDEPIEEYYSIKSKPTQTNVHMVKLLSAIEHDNPGYVELLELLENVGKNDKVILQLAGPGGSVDTGILLVNAIRDCACGVDVVVIGRCFSMHALLAVSGKSLVMKPNTWLMFHNYSGGERGKGTEMLDATISTYEHIHEFFDDMAHPFLSTSEMNKVKNDTDVYVRASDRNLKKRIKRHFNGKSK